MPHDDIDRLKVIQTAYGLQPVADMGGLAAAIIQRRELLIAGDLRRVLTVIGQIVVRESTFDALMAGGTVPPEVRAEMARAAETENGATPGANVVEEVLGDIARTLGSHQA